MINFTDKACTALVVLGIVALVKYLNVVPILLGIGQAFFFQ